MRRETPHGETPNRALRDHLRGGRAGAGFVPHPLPTAPPVRLEGPLAERLEAAVVPSATFDGSVCIGG